MIRETDHRIREHKVYTADHKTLLAHATILDYLEVAASAVPEDAGTVADKVFLPKSLKLEWLQEKLSIF